jgi:hypothetical protein
MDDIQRLLAYEEIRQLAYRYALATDSRDMDALVNLFVDDVRVGPDRYGREALRQDLTQRLHDVGITILSVTNHIIDLEDENHARGVVYCHGEIQDGERWIVQAIQYGDKYERRNGQWYFVRRKHVLWYGAELGQNPLRLPPANWPASHTGRGTLPESWDSWRKFWQGTDTRG